MDDKFYFEKGLQRVNKIIDFNPKYDLILGEKLENPVYKKILDGGNLNEEELKNHLKRRVKNSRKIYKLNADQRKRKVVGFFPTLNNKKEKDFILRNLSDSSYKADILDLSDLTVEKVNHEETGKDELLIEYLIEYLKNKKLLTLSNIHQSISYFLSYTIALNTLRNIEGLVLVVLANDHSPLPVAFWAAAKRQTLKTLYVQHAEITESFPPLEFDFAVLKNRVSGYIYKSIKRTDCKIFYGTRESRLIDAHGLLVNRRKIDKKSKLKVVVYLTAIFNVSSVIKLIDFLNNSNNIGYVGIKPHPSFWKFNNESPFEGVELLREHVVQPHVAICGNSSVVLELIQRGNIVVQDFSLDEIKNDYYGFVRNGLVNEIDFGALADSDIDKLVPFNNMEVLGNYFPNFDNKINKLDRYNFIDFISRLRNEYFSEDKIFDKPHSVVLYLSVFPIAFSNVVNDEVDDWLDQFSIVSALNKAFDDRNTDLLEFFPLVNFENTSTAAKFWFQSKRIEWNGYHPSEVELEAMLDFSLDNSCERKLKGWLETKAFDLSLRVNSYRGVIRVLKNSKYFSIKRSPANRIVSFKKYIITRSHTEQIELSKYLPAISELSPLSQLKIEVQGETPKSKNNFDYRALELRFMQSHEPIKDEYKYLVSSVYSKISARAKFIDVKYQHEQKELLLVEILDCLKLKKGFSFIRLSDGEGFIFREKTSFFTEEDSLNRQRHWWGRELSEFHEASLRERLFCAAKNADLLGIPSVYRFIRDHSDKTRSLKQSLQGRGLLSVLSAIPSIDTPNKLYTDDKANTAIFKDTALLNYLNALATKTILITSGREDRLAGLFENKSKLRFIQVPTHQKTSGNKNYINTELPIPYHLDELQVQLEKLVEKGALVLVGAGVAGKVFCDIAKENSAIGLDLGSVFDELVGGGIHSLF